MVRPSDMHSLGMFAVRLACVSSLLSLSAWPSVQDGSLLFPNRRKVDSGTWQDIYQANLITLRKQRAHVVPFINVIMTRRFEVLQRRQFDANFD